MDRIRLAVANDAHDVHFHNLLHELVGELRRTEEPAPIQDKHAGFQKLRQVEVHERNDKARE
eukprot:5676870-Pleurochrysis_carterae.AAC.1